MTDMTNADKTWRFKHRGFIIELRSREAIKNNVWPAAVYFPCGTWLWNANGYLSAVDAIDSHLKNGGAREPNADTFARTAWLNEVDERD